VWQYGAIFIFLENTSQGLPTYAAKRVKNIKYNYTGCGVVGTADAATFELIKLATLQLYSRY
jgi:hypothetical protein